MRRLLWFWLAIGWIGFVILPWYQQEYGFWTLEWLTDGYPFYGDYAPAILQGLMYDRPWLLPVAACLMAPFAVMGRTRQDPVFGNVLIASGALGLGYMLAQGFAIGVFGFNYAWLTSLFGEADIRQYGLGYGALFCAASFVVLFCAGLAARGTMRGDVFVTTAIGTIIVLVATFVFFPVSRILMSAFVDMDGALSGAAFMRNFVSPTVWGLGCLAGGVCGVAWNTAFLAILTATSTTLLGLAFALVVTRTGFRWKKSLRVLTVLPIITPPFVIGLALILLFGRSGTVTQFIADLLGVEAGRWLYGLPGIWLAQTLSFTPISFLVLIGVVEGVSPSMEEASQTLRADRWQTFVNVSLPLMRPGLANAFLLAFIESMADFGNPMVLGGNYEVLSTDIFFAIVGAQNDQGRAAVLAIILLVFTLSAFAAQRFWLGKKSYATVSGKADNGAHVGLSNGLRRVCYGTAIPWALFTIVIYGMIFFGAFVKRWGFDNSLTLDNYVEAFGIGWSDHGIVWAGAAWDSFWTTLNISIIAAPLTAAVGLTTAYLLVRQNFRGKNAFEFGTMLSFAIPGTVIGVSYILAFNVPPLELTGTGVILVICFVFRNMPVGVRGGIAAMSQLDKSLDEASLTLGANSFTTFRKVILPLLRPAIVAALVYSFVRAITSVSAVIFLVSADHNMATSYIIGLVENGRYGVAIAYCSVLILVMLTVIVVVQGLIGKRKLRREDRVAADTTKTGGKTAQSGLREKHS